jgi:thiamine-monophosphate kinase
LAAQIDLESLPLSPSAAAWLRGQPDRAAALRRLATGGDDYEVIAAIAPEDVEAYAQAAGMNVAVVGRLVEGEGVEARLDGAMLALDRLGYSHGG